MSHREHLAIIGSGASAIYFLKHFLDEADLLKRRFREITVFEKRRVTGVGMPYSPQTTDRFNMCNISSEEIPELPETFADWLRAQEPAVLKDLHLENEAIREDEIYNRLALGQYLRAQYETMVARLRDAGVAVHERPCCEIVDMQDDGEGRGVTLISRDGSRQVFDRVIIATGHRWPEQDDPERGYYASPWPMAKLLPAEGECHCFPIGTLGASLSAFDVVSSLAHRHGEFVDDDGWISFIPREGTVEFKIVMHAGHGVLPHLQFDQDEPFRDIYRHVDREGLLALVKDGYLRMETYFDKVCRPALTDAFTKDGMREMVDRLADPAFGWEAFVEALTEQHTYDNAFEGMRFEMKEALDSVNHHRPVHWKEVIDDLMYTLNFHAELLPAEDHLLLHKTVMPFLMNVIAAMPLASGKMLLALYDASKLELVSGKVTIDEAAQDDDMTTITVEGEEDAPTTLRYRMFVDCSGQKPLELDDYPFPSLVKSGTVRTARAPFLKADAAPEIVPEEKKDHLLNEGGTVAYAIGGVDIDGAYRLIGHDGQANPRLHDISFPHTTGVRPYSYGLQACSDTAAILTQFLVEEVRAGTPVESDMETLTEIYETTEKAEA